MPFKLNEAPNLALSKISSHKTKRDCGTLWSILCCIPSIGFSIDCCDDSKKQDEFKGCYPRSLSPHKKGSLNAIIEGLQDLRINNSELKKVVNKDAIVNQVQGTIKLLKEAMKADLPQGYLDAIKAAYDEITMRAKVEQNIRIATDLKESPLITGHDFEVPNYFTLNK